mmetsp:Transcript_18601/g.36450  ORF Transcript_18601/g.36450 Transcript_18601/m.36450 type:complete len:260 (+) Transcript_18601:271-1050(+)
MLWHPISISSPGYRNRYHCLRYLLSRQIKSAASEREAQNVAEERVFLLSWMRCKATSRWARVTTNDVPCSGCIASRIAASTASVLAALTSAHEQPSRRSATSSKSTSSLQGVRIVASIARRSSNRGIWTRTEVPKRPGRRRAASRASSREQAPTTSNPCRVSIPSSSFKKVASTRLLDALVCCSPPDPRSLRVAILSSSSKNKIQGAAWRARENRSRISRSLSPTYLETKSEDLMLRKLQADAWPILCARNVFPQPDGP